MFAPEVKERARWRKKMNCLTGNTVSVLVEFESFYRSGKFNFPHSTIHERVFTARRAVVLSNSFDTVKKRAVIHLNLLQSSLLDFHRLPRAYAVAPCPNSNDPNLLLHRPLTPLIWRHVPFSRLQRMSSTLIKAVSCCLFLAKDWTA